MIFTGHQPQPPPQQQQQPQQRPQPQPQQSQESTVSPRFFSFFFYTSIILYFSYNNHLEHLDHDHIPSSTPTPPTPPSFQTTSKPLNVSERQWQQQEQELEGQRVSSRW